MSSDTVAVTGGNGTLGRAVVAHLRERGYRTANLSRHKADEAGADVYSKTDLLDAGEVYGSLARCDPDAIVHLGAVPTPTRTPGHVTFESNVMGSYHVLEAAQGLGVDDVVLASSLCAMGAGYESDRLPVEYLPVDEGHPLRPSNPYGLGKQAVEVTADGVARRDGGPDVVSLRFPWVTTPADVEETFVDADRSLAGIRETGRFRSIRNSLFSYLHVEDAVRLVEAALTADIAGHERFLASAPDTTADAPTADLVAEAYPEAEVRDGFEGDESLVSSAKAARLLDWAPERSWRDEV